MSFLDGAMGAVDVPSVDFGTAEPVYSYAATMPGDLRDNAQMTPFMPAAARAQGMSWWESIAAYGLTRAIDNKYAATPVLGNTYPASFAGQNGATYQAGRPAAGMPVAAQQGGFLGISPTMLLIGGGVLLYLATRD